MTDSSFFSNLFGGSGTRPSFPGVGDYPYRFFKEMWSAARGHAKGFTELAAPQVATEPVTLTVTRGTQTAQYAIESNEYTIGGDGRCNLVIPGMAGGTAFQISVRDEPIGRAAYISVLSPGIIVGDEETKVNEIILLKNNDRVRIRGIIFAISGLAKRDYLNSISGFFAKRTNILLPCIIAFSVSVILMTYGVATFLAESPSRVTQNSSAEKHSPAQVIAEMGEALQSARIPGAVGLSESGREITVDAGKAGLDATGERRLHAIIDAISRTSALPIIDMSKPDAAISRLIAAVAIYPIQVVIGRDGRRYRVGETIAESWTITTIGLKHIGLTRGNVIATIDVPQMY